MRVVIVPLDVLRDAVNPNAGYILSANNGPRGSESTECTGCGIRNINGWHKTINHKDNCSYVAQEKALKTIHEILQCYEQTQRKI